MILILLTKNKGEKMNDKEKIRLMVDTLSNDEISTDQELIKYFISANIPEKVAIGYVQNRDKYLRALFIQKSPTIKKNIEMTPAEKLTGWC